MTKKLIKIILLLLNFLQEAFISKLKVRLLFFNFLINRSKIYIFVIDQDLEKYFQKYGKLEEVVIIKEKATGKSKGYGFVTYIVYPYESEVTEAKR